MTVKKPVPCSIYDIRGIQEWLDEMALQGLFLTEVNRRFDRAVFEQGDPAPVRYRLDPVGKNTEKDKDREEPYAQMGWKFVDYIPKWYYIFSCDDQSAPELYSDPQSLAIAMEPMIRRDVRNHVLLTLFLLFAFFLPLLTPDRTFRDLLLWEDPRNMVLTVFYPFVLILCVPILVFESRKLLKIRDALAQGLPLKAKKRRNRPPWYVIWALTYLPFFALPRLFLPSVGWEVCSLEDFTPSHPWPTTVQLEAVGPSPLEQEPSLDGYVKYNDSAFAPVQESIHRYQPAADPDTFSSFSVDIRYVQASSPRVARWIYRLELKQEFKYLKSYQDPTYTYRFTDLTEFTPQDWPGLDRLEVIQYQRYGEDSWAFAALRGTDILLVRYTGLSRWEDCLPLFLEALNKTES